MYVQLIQQVEAVLTQLGLNPPDAKISEGQYNISKNQTEVLIDAWEDQDRVFLQVLSPVTKITTGDRAEVLRMLLEENHGMVEAAFSLVKNDIVIKITVDYTGGASAERILASMSRVGFYSELYRSKWQELSQPVQ